MEKLETLKALLTDQLGPFGPVLAVGILGMFLVLLTLPILLRKKADPLDKLRAANKQTSHPIT